jgi:hypothetical protein
MEIDETSISNEEQRELIEGLARALATVVPSGSMGDGPYEQIERVAARHDLVADIVYDDRHHLSIGNAYGKALLGEGYAIVGVHPNADQPDRVSNEDSLTVVELESSPTIVSNEDHPYEHIFLPGDDTVRDRLRELGLQDMSQVVEDVIDEYPGLVEDFKDGSHGAHEYLVCEIRDRVNDDVDYAECRRELKRQL